MTTVEANLRFFKEFLTHLRKYMFPMAKASDLKVDTGNDGDVVLSFYNSCLLKSDLRLLDGPHWLNDAIIAFYFEYLENVTYKEYSEQLALLNPCCTKLIKFSKDCDVKEIIQCLSLQKKNYIFNAINDGTITGWNTGTHWSLLVFSRPNKTFYYYDSLRGYNSDHAHEVAKKLIPHLGLRDPADFLQQECPQQSNGFDCGLHIIANVDILMKHFLLGYPSEWYSHLDSETKRAELKALIYSLK